MEDEVRKAVKIILEYCQNIKCCDCIFHDMTLHHDCRLMTGMPCNCDSKEKKN